jgi:tripartite-type tricarboxylate transporter receptor subunit TctC
MIRRLACCLAALLLGALPATAETWPSRPVHIVVPFPPGGPADALARLFGNKLSELWGQPIIVDNRAGASGTIASRLIAKAPPDGALFLLYSSSQVINLALYKDPGYDPFTDFTPVSRIAGYMLVLVVHPSLKITSVAELVAAAKARPGALTFGSAGGGGAPTHLAGELFKRAAGIDLLHVPYTGAAPATNALLAGEVDMMFNNPLSALPQVKAGQLRALAVTGETRMAQAPDLPTIAESGYPGFEAGTWFALAGPAGLPPAIAERATRDMMAVARLPDIRARLAEQGLDVIGGDGAELARASRAELDHWAPIIKAANIHAD